MAGQHATTDASLRGTIDESEWRARVDLAACYRLMAIYGMTDLIYNHITARVPGQRDQVLINPYGRLYEEVTASSLLKIDLDGNILGGNGGGYGVNYAGFVIHSAVHRERHDAECVIHTHTRATMAVSALKEGLLPLSQTSMRFYDRVAYHAFEGPVVNLEEQARLVADLGDHNVLFLRNHGTLVCAPSVAQAFNIAYFLEMACKAQVDTLAMDRDIALPSPEIAERTAQNFLSGSEPMGVLEWPAMLRLLDRRGADYAI